MSRMNWANFYSTNEITEMTPQDLAVWLKHSVKCGQCSECACDVLNLFYKGENLGGENRCGTKGKHFQEVLLDLLSNIGSPVEETKEEPVEEKPVRTADLHYSQTIDFMKRKGYSKCYMCGSDLEV